MTKYKGKILFMAILVIAFSVSTVLADWEVEQIESVFDDGMITETGGKFFASPWVEIVGGSVNLNSYFAFRGVTIPDDSQIESAYLEFTAPFPWNYNQSIPVTVYGLKAGDQPSWDPTPDLNGHIVTTNFTNHDMYDLISSNKINVTITDIVKEIYNLNAWESNNDMGFKVSALAVSGGVRYQEAYESDPNSTLKLFIEYTENTTTKWYYKDYEIDLVTAGNATALKWYDATDIRMRLTTAIGTDYLTQGVDPKANYSNIWERDTVASVGTDFYTIVNKPTSPWNTSLYRTSDRGITWTKIVDLEPTPGNLENGQMYAIAYDQNNTLHLAWCDLWDTWTAEFKIHNQSLIKLYEVFDGGNNVGEHRMFWDPSLDTIWVTRFGADPSGSARHPWIARKNDTTKVWESYKFDITDYRDNDVIVIGGKVYWAIHQEGAGAASQWLRLYNLTNYNDLTSWNFIGLFDAGGYFVSFDLGEWNGDPAVSIETTISGNEYLKQYTYDGGFTLEGVFNLTSYKPASKPEFHSPKMYFNANGNLRMASVVEQDSGYSLIDKSWGAYFISQPPPPSTVQKATAHWIYSIGGDMRPFSVGQTSWVVTPPPGEDPPDPDCIAQAVTLEDIQACIDNIPGVGETPDDPNPPGTTYPDDGFGEITRFNLRFTLWAIGWVLMIVPFFAMAWKTYTIKIYLMFILMFMLGLGLQWSLGSI